MTAYKVFPKVMRYTACVGRNTSPNKQWKFTTEPKKTKVTGITLGVDFRIDILQNTVYEVPVPTTSKMMTTKMLQSFKYCGVYRFFFARNECRNKNVSTSQYTNNR